MQYYRAIPARGTYPSPVDHDDDPRSRERFEHDPRGYHPDWQRGWQEGYTHGWHQWTYRGHVPRHVDEDQWHDGFRNGVNVGTYDGLRRYTQRDAPPSPWWRDPHAEPGEGYQQWRVVIEIDAPGTSPRVAAENAWAALGSDGPPTVSVYPLLGSPGDAVDIDLADDPHTDEQE